MRAGAIARAVLAAAVLAAAPGCSSNPVPAPATAPAETPAAEPVAGPGTAPDDDETAAAAPAESDPADDPTVVTIEPAGGRAEEPRTLAEAAQAARARRGDQPRATTVINNENLAEWAARGQVTTAPDPAGTEPAAATAAEADTAGTGTAAAPAPSDPATAGAGPSSGADAPGAPAGPRDEAYWRDRARELRTRWADAAEEIERLEKEAADLRWAFYAEDDGYYRDERIKPSWDRALDDLRRARQDERYFRDQVEELMEDGRRAGALPGWLREGVELEPEDHGDSDAPIGREPRSTEPIEPPTTGEERPR